MFGGGSSGAFAIEQLLAFLFMPPLLRDVTRNLGGADDISSSVFDGRNGEGHVDPTPIFSDPHRLVVINALAPIEPCKNLRFFIDSIRRNQHRDRLADGLRRTVTKRSLSSGVPAGDNALQCFADNRVICGLDDCREARSQLLRLFGLADVPKAPHSSGGLAVDVLDLREPLDNAPVFQPELVEDFLAGRVDLCHAG